MTRDEKLAEAWAEYETARAEYEANPLAIHATVRSEALDRYVAVKRCAVDDQPKVERARKEGGR